jgi:hypothetical protein
MGMRVRARWAFWLAVAPLLLWAQPSQEQADDVLEAALRGVTLEFLTAEVRATGAVACLQLDPGGAPQSVSKEFLRRFRGLTYVRRGAECETHPAGGFERATRAPAIILTAGPVEWLSADEAHVQVAYFQSQRGSGRRTYRVVREPSGWISLGQILKMSPA